MPRNGWLRQGTEWLPWVYWGQLVHVPRGGRPVLTPEGTGACAGEAVVLAPRRGSQGITFMDVHGWCDARGFHWRASRCQGSTLKGIKAPRGDAQRRRDARGNLCWHWGGGQQFRSAFSNARHSRSASASTTHTARMPSTLADGSRPAPGRRRCPGPQRPKRWSPGSLVCPGSNREGRNGRGSRSSGCTGRWGMRGFGRTMTRGCLEPIRCSQNTALCALKIIVIPNIPAILAQRWKVS